MSKIIKCYTSSTEFLIKIILRSLIYVDTIFSSEIKTNLIIAPNSNFKII